MTVLLYAALSGALFLLPFVLIQVHGYSATAAGAAFLPFSILIGLGSRWSGGLVEQFGARLPLVLGPAVTGGGFVLLAVSGHITNYWTGFLPGLIILGIGMTLSVAPLTTTVFDSVPAAKSGVASGINNAAARVGSLLAVAALGLVFGGSGAASLQVTTLVDAYSLVMLAAAAFAALSALVAAATIRSPEVSQPGAAACCIEARSNRCCGRRKIDRLSDSDRRPEDIRRTNGHHRSVVIVAQSVIRSRARRSPRHCVIAPIVDATRALRWLAGQCIRWMRSR